MKQPRLPGAEKFKFSGQQITERECLNDASSRRKEDEPPTDFSFIRGHSSYSSCPSSYYTNLQGFTRSDVKRRPLLPISSKKTSRVLNNTSAELNIDNIDVREDKTSSSVSNWVSRPNDALLDKFTLHGRRSTRSACIPLASNFSLHNTSDSTSIHSRLSSSHSSRTSHSESSDVPVSSVSSPRSSEAYPSPDSTPSPSTSSSPRSSQISHSSTERCLSPAHILPCSNPPFNWMNHRSSPAVSWRSSSRCSCASEEEIWVLRKTDV